MLNGTALAAESGQDNTAQTTTVVANNEATVDVTESSLKQVSGTGKTESTPSQMVSSSEQLSSNSDPAVLPDAQSSTSSVIGTDTATVLALTPQSVVSTQTADTEQSAATLAAPIQATVPEPRTQLTPTSSGWVMVASLSDAAAAVAQPEITRAIEVAAAALPPVNTPVVPKGLLGQWSQELAGVTLSVVVSGIVSMNTGFQAAVTLEALILLLLGIAGMSYGAWLRRVGHVTAARSDLTSTFFATPLLMDFIRVSPPERGPFLGVSDTNRLIINYQQKGVML